MREHPFASLALLFIVIFGVCLGSDKYSERRYQIGYDAGYEAGYTAALNDFSTANVASTSLSATALGVLTAENGTSTLPKDCDYILNKSTKKFHYPSCPSVKQMKEKNKIYFTGDRKEVIQKGYQPCGRCNP